MKITTKMTMEQNNIEIRAINNLQVDPETKTVKGRAIVFNSNSAVLQTENGVKFIERIMPEAVTEEFLAKQDIMMLYNHSSASPYTIMARSKYGKGTLKLAVDSEGVSFEFKPKKKDYGIVESLEAGDLDGASFAFRLPNDPSAQTITRRSDGLVERQINKFDMIKDISIVDNPAYPATTVSLRSLEEAVAELEKPAPEPVPEPVKNEAEENEKKFNEYYQRMKRKYLM